MTNGVHFPTNSNEFALCVSNVEASVDTTARLPNWPFLAPSGYAMACEFDHLLGSGFVPVIEALADQYGDETISMVVVDPSPEYYRSEYAYFPGFRVDRNALHDGYWSGLSHEPGQDPTGAIAYTGNVVTLVGASQAWAVWGQRDWEIALLLTPVPEGSWLSVGVPFLDPRRAIAELRAPSGWSKALTETEIKTLLGNADQRGRGRG